MQSREEENFLRPKPLNTNNRTDRIGSKTAPIDTNFDFEFNEEDYNNSYTCTYNYYIYYHSLKPRDPRLPKPTYKFTPDMDFIKRGKVIERNNSINECEINDQMANLCIKDEKDNYSKFTNYTSNELSPINFSNNYINYEYSNNIDYLQYYDCSSQKPYLLSSDYKIDVNQEEFLPNKKKSDMNEFYLNIINICKDHNGSRMVQKKFQDSDEKEKNHMIQILKPHIYEISKDVFGNYVIQKILENKERCSLIMEQLSENINELSFHVYGCRVIQKAIEVLPIEEIIKIFDHVKHNLLKFIEDQNGNHVLQKLIERISDKQKLHIINLLKDKTLYLCKHQYGCRILQKIFEFCKDDEYFPILDRILNNVFELSQHQYGNYVLQHIIEYQNNNERKNILNQLQGRIFELSVHKYASNVIEKLLTHGSQILKDYIIQEIISMDDKIHDSLLSLVKDKYGNYVVQKLIEVADFNMKENIIRKIINSQALNKRDGFCKQIMI